MFNTETIFRVHKNKNYTTMCNIHFDDRRLSLKAVGLHSFILSKPDDWKIIRAGDKAWHSVCSDIWQS